MADDVRTGSAGPGAATDPPTRVPRVSGAARERRAGPWRRAVVPGMLLLLVVSLVAGRSWHADVVGTGDAIAMYRPGPGDLSAGWEFSLSDRFSDDFSSSPWSFTARWYENWNGRLSQALAMSPFVLFSPRSPAPEDFPWWFILSLTLFCIVATPPLLAVLLENLGDEGPGAPALVTVALWAAWSLHPTVYATGVLWAFSLAGHYLPPLLAAAALVWVTRRPLPAWGRRVWGAYALILCGLCLFGEQYLPSFPILFLAVPLALWRPWEMRARIYRTFAAVTAAATAAAAGIYFASPGQRWRNPLIAADAPRLSPAALADWYREACSAGYRLILPRGLAENAWLAHAALLVVLAAAVLALTRSVALRPEEEAAGRRRREAALGVGVLALALLVAYHASLATLLVSTYFPPRAVVYPALLLAAGLAFALRFLWLLPGIAVDAPGPAPASAARLRAGLGAGLAAALLLAGWGNARLAAREHRENELYLAERLHYLRKIVDLHRATGQRRFLIQRGVRGGHEFEARGLWAYLQWRGYPQILAYDSNDAPPGTEDGDFVRLGISLEETP